MMWRIRTVICLLETNPLEEQALGHGGGAGAFAVAAGDDLGNAVGMPVSAADFKDGADHGADHVEEEAVAFDAEDDEGAAAVDVAGEDGADGEIAFVFDAFEGVEIVLADEVPAGVLHALDVEVFVEVVGEVAEEEGAVAIGPDEVAVAFVLGAADVEVFGDFGHVADEDVFGEAGVDGAAEAFGVEGGVGAQDGDLALGVDAGIGAGGAVDDDGVAEDDAGGDLDLALDGGDGIALALPSAVGRAVVGESHAKASDGHGAEPFARLLEQQFGDLDGVEGCAFEELIAGDKHAEAATGGVGGVLADTAAEDVALTGSVFGHGHVVFLNVIDDFDAGGFAEEGADFGGGDGAFALDGEGFGVGAKDRDADAGGGDADVIVAEDFLSFFNHLGFFFVVAGGGVDPGVVAEEVEGVGVGEDGVFVFAAFEVGAGGFAEFFHGGGAGTAGGLVGGGDEAGDAIDLVDGPERGDGDDGAAVGVGDDALVGFYGLGVDLGDDEGHGGIHTESGRVIDGDGSGLGSEGAEFFGDAAAGGEEGDVDAGKAGFCEFLNGDGPALEGHGFTGGARGSEEAQFLHGEFALIETVEKFDADGTSGTNNRDYGVRQRHMIALGLSGKKTGTNRADDFYEVSGHAARDAFRGIARRGHAGVGYATFLPSLKNDSSRE